MRALPVRVAALVSVAGLAAACAPGSNDGEELRQPTISPSTPATTAEPSTESPSPSGEDEAAGPPRVVDTVATGLEVPWGLDFLPDGSAVVTERDSGRVLAIEGGDVREIGRLDEEGEVEAGLLGVAVSPDFESDSTLFFYLTTAEDNRVVRATYDGERIGEPEAILTGIPNGFIHDGGRLEFGPDGHLFVSTGEIGEPELAQQRDSLGGKILRITTDGDPAPGNPDPDSPIWSLGHRNVQGLAFDEDGQLWASEFGAQTFDELNRINKGDNYGWPLFEGDGSTEGYVDPQVVWRTSEASPSGLAHLDGQLWMASLRGERLWRITIDGNRAVEPKDFFVGDYGRLRSVEVAPDGNLWVTTSNRDGRGEPAEADDRILVVKP